VKVVKDEKVRREMAAVENNKNYEQTTDGGMGNENSMGRGIE
jgi:hypothetical protein